jgi:hypothetical protein
VKEYRCDRCKKPILQGSVVYELRANYSPINHTESHYHWTCLFEYLLSDAEQSMKGTWIPNPKYKEG